MFSDFFAAMRRYRKSILDQLEGDDLAYVQTRVDAMLACAKQVYDLLCVSGVLMSRLSHAGLVRDEQLARKVLAEAVADTESSQVMLEFFRRDEWDRMRSVQWQ